MDVETILSVSVFVQSIGLLGCAIHIKKWGKTITSLRGRVLLLQNRVLNVENWHEQNRVLAAIQSVLDESADLSATQRKTPYQNEQNGNAPGGGVPFTITPKFALGDRVRVKSTGFEFTVECISFAQDEYLYSTNKQIALAYEGQLEKVQP